MLIELLPYKYNSAEVIAQYNEVVVPNLEFTENRYTVTKYDCYIFVPFKHGMYDPRIKGTIFEHFIKVCDRIYNINSATFRMLEPSETISWHTDNTNSVHLAVSDCPEFKYYSETEEYTMDSGSTYFLRSAEYKHMVTNHGNTPRANLHLWLNE